MSPDESRAVRGRERRVRWRGRARRRGGALPPRLEQVEQAWRSLPDQGVGIGAIVTQNLGRGFVDEADAIVRVDHQQALAQVLQDVLRQLREVGEIDFMAAHQGFALAQAGGHRPGGECHEEQHGAEYSGGQVVGGRGCSRHAHEYLLHQYDQRRDRGDQQRIAWTREHGERKHRQHEEYPKTARRPTARVDDESDGNRIDGGVHQGDDTQARPAQPPRNDEQHRGGEVGDARAHEQARTRRDQLPPGARERLYRQQHQRHQQPIEVQEPDHAPGEIARCHDGGGGDGRCGAQADGGGWTGARL